MTQLATAFAGQAGIPDKDTIRFEFTQAHVDAFVEACRASDYDVKTAERLDGDPVFKIAYLAFCHHLADNHPALLVSHVLPLESVASHMVNRQPGFAAVLDKVAPLERTAFLARNLYLFNCAPENFVQATRSWIDGMAMNEKRFLTQQPCGNRLMERMTALAEGRHHTFVS